MLSVGLGFNVDYLKADNFFGREWIGRNFPKAIYRDLLTEHGFDEQRNVLITNDLKPIISFLGGFTRIDVELPDVLKFIEVKYLAS